LTLTLRSETMSAVLEDEVRVMWFKRSVRVSEPGDVFRTLMYNRI